MVSVRRQRRPRANAHPAVRSGSTAGRARWHTPRMAKVAIIGAGSVEFTRNILTDLCSAPELHGTLELALHDIDGERLAYAERAANQVVERLDAGYKVQANADPRGAFQGAAYPANET